MTAPTREKADRLIREKRVHYKQTIPDGSMVYWVDGDSGRTRVVTLTTNGETTCDCPAMIPDCAHVLAVLDLHAPPPDPARGTVVSPDDPIEHVRVPSREPADEHGHVDDPPIPGNGDQLIRLKPDEPAPELTAENLAATFTDDDETDASVPVVGDDGPRGLVDPQQRRDLIDLADAPFTFRMLETISRTDFVPAALRGKPAAMLAAILTGRELGLGPMTSMREIYVIDGSPTLSAALWLRLYRQAGHRLTVEQADERVVTITGTRGDTDEQMTVTFTLEDAIRGNLVVVTDDGEIRARSRSDNALPWETYTPDMLWARAVTRLVRRLAPDLVETGVSP